MTKAKKERAAVMAIKELLTEEDEGHMLKTLQSVLAHVRGEGLPHLATEVIKELARTAYIERLAEVLTGALSESENEDPPPGAEQ